MIIHKFEPKPLIKVQIKEYKKQHSLVIVTHEQRDAQTIAAIPKEHWENFPDLETLAQVIADVYDAAFSQGFSAGNVYRIGKIRDALCIKGW